MHFLLGKGLNGILSVEIGVLVLRFMEGWLIVEKFLDISIGIGKFLF